MSRRLLALLVTFGLLAALPAFAAAPLGVQGVLRAAGGGPAPDGKYAITFKLYDGLEPDAKVLWSEVQVAVAVSGGLFGTELDAAGGGITAELLGSAPGIWLGVRISDDPELPRQALHAVPFARRADVAALADVAKLAQAAEKLTGPLDGSQLAQGTVPATALAFAAAGAKVAGGGATGLDCTGCITLGHFADDVLAAPNVGFYDNKSGLGASTVQAAIDKLAGQDKATAGLLQPGANGTVGLGKTATAGCGVDLQGPLCVGGAKAMVILEVADAAAMQAAGGKGTVVLRLDTGALWLHTATGWKPLLTGAVCGDGQLEGAEQCDDGAQNADAPDKCRTTCKKPICGDVITDSGEQCDDGNTVSTDACVACQKAKCGDGQVQAGVEACDDGNASNTDACVQGCKAAICGDGFVQAGPPGNPNIEECDLGPDNGGAGKTCSSACKNVNLLTYHKNGNFFVSDKTYAGDFNKDGGFCTKMLGQQAYVASNNASVPNPESGGTWNGNGNSANAQYNCMLYTVATGEGYGVQGGYGPCTGLRHVVCSTSASDCNAGNCSLWD